MTCKHRWHFMKEALLANVFICDKCGETKNISIKIKGFAQTRGDEQ